jgi:hypothetical protein
MLAPALNHHPRNNAERLLESFAARPANVLVYKNTASLEAGLAGECDLDLVVSLKCLASFEAVVQEQGGVRAVPSRFYDNAVPSRRDWIVPLSGEKVLHFDIASPIVVGRKFCKAYRLTHGIGLREAAIPLVSFEDEARFALARFAFNHPAGLFDRWLTCPDELRRVVEPVLQPSVTNPEWEWREGAESAQCRFHRTGGAITIERASLAAIRKAVRRANRASALAPLRDGLVHASRRTAHALVRRIGRLLPGSAIGKRHLATGTIIALIGPDGVGKSTQSADLARHFGHRLASCPIYLGSNDGSWMRIRRKLALGRKPRAVARSAARSGAAQRTGERSWLHAHGSALWRLIIALQRMRALRQALRLAKSGVIVIADRWPQILEPGLLDGPSVQPPARYRIAQALWRAEQRIYRALARHRPGLMIHLDCDFATSHQRKPGDISAEAFAARLDLMARMRAADGAIVVVDARQSREQVFHAIAHEAWRHLGAINRG